MRTLLSTASAAITLAAAGVAQTIVPGSFVTSGTGCVASDNMIYELFDAGVFDLDNTAHEYLQNGAGSYIVIPSTGSIIPPTGMETSLNGDDTVFPAIPISFTFSYPAGAGSTTEIIIGANGHVFFEPETENRCCNGVTARNDALIDTAPSIAGFNNDLNLSTTSTSGNGRIWHEEQTIGGATVFLATWEDAGEFGVPTGGALHNFQIQIWDDPSSAAGDRVVVAYGTTTPTTDTTFVGWSAGNGQPDLGSADFTNLPIDGGDGTISRPLTLSSNDVPSIGNTFNFDLGDVPASSVAGAILVGLPIPGGVPLDIIGIEGCFLYTDGGITNIPATLTAPTGTASFNIPNDPNAVGLPLETQGAVIAPGSTTLGVVTSNAGTLTIGSAGTIPTTGIIALASGTNSFNSNTASGFWSIDHQDASRPNITSVTFDYTPATTAPANLQRFDTDQTGMADRFDGGNSAAAGCAGTYRNGSDATTGLVYDPATQSTASCATAPEVTGWIGSNPGTIANDFGTITFNFTDFNFGEKFEFDCDTDGTTANGGAQQGCVVTITYADGSSSSGPLVFIDANNSAQQF